MKGSWHLTPSWAPPATVTPQLPGPPTPLSTLPWPAAGEGEEEPSNAKTNSFLTGDSMLKARFQKTDVFPNSKMSDTSIPLFFSLFLLIYARMRSAPSLCQHRFFWLVFFGKSWESTVTCTQRLMR